MRYGNDNGSYQIVDLPGCSQVAVSIHSFIFKNRRGMGLGREAHQMRLREIAKLGYDYVVCTVRDGNIPEIKILQKFGWCLLDTFVSSSTDHRIRLYGKKLR